MTRRGSAPLVGALLRWYEEVGRDLPWRRHREPYAIWVSEVMLQQTQVRTVLPYFERWLRRFPTLSALAAADEDAVLHAWEGLGYYSRARNLRRAARTVVEEHGGELPRTAAALRALPGIGEYSAAAIASIAFDEPVPVIDGNVVRVLSRVYALRGDPTRAPVKHELRERARRLVPEERPGDFNQALMELGATVCVPERPRCGTCPLTRHCRAQAEGLAAVLPELPPRPSPQAVAMAAAVVVRRGRVAVMRLPKNAPRWPSMWVFPNGELAPGEPVERGAERIARDVAGLAVRAETQLGVLKHSVTRFRIHLAVTRCKHESGPTRAQPELAWRRIDELGALAMPAAHRRIAGWLG
ncbi:MAG TPA: A/G-specific adenine glycosylase [Polyangiaceae bacterium]|nr:A/G-specific adenine glycosylase [Polyangiaceae bacterium]